MGGVSKNEEFLKHLEENFEPEIPHPNLNKKHKVICCYIHIFYYYAAILKGLTNRRTSILIVL